MTRSRTSVLIVEDERIVARDLQETLRELGYDPFAVASSSDEALARASERRPDIALMDIRIQGKRDGIETASILREKFDVPIVYLTAHADDVTIERAKRTEPQGYVVKPVKAGELRGAIEVALYNAQTERRLRERERLFSTTLHSIKDAVVAVDLASKVTFMNHTAETLTGVTCEEAVGKPVGDILRLVESEATPSAETPLAIALREKRAVVLREGRLVNIATGVESVITDSAALVVDKGQTLGAVMVFRDVTKEKKAQKQLELADRLASLGTMAAGVAHEVNNPLAVLFAYGTLLTEDLAKHREDLARLGIQLGPKAEQRLDEIRESLGHVGTASERIARIVADLSAFSRPVEQGSSLIDVVKAVEWAIRTTSHELRYRARLITALGRVPVVLADDARLGQVFINLLINAAHAIAPGNADANQVRVCTRTDAEGRAVIEIQDTGTGMSDEVRARIFEPFFTTKAQGVGTGLGLSISQGIVGSFGGQIQVESAPAGGTIFRVILPAAPHEPAQAAATPASSEGPFRRGRILIVDDEAMVLTVLRRILDDHEVVCVERASDALALLTREERFDLMFLDVVMPAVTGMEFYARVVDLFPDLASRIVFNTGGAITPEMHAFLQSVPNLRIDKPFEVTAIRGAVQRLLAEVRD